ncbi:MAG: glutaredoxin family protein [Myxococcales bacterium]|nr:glutaredoxin family protein [Myxococcales bacterium]
MAPGPRRCPVHDLALSPEGTCLRCGGEPRLRARPKTEPLLSPTSTRTKLLRALVASLAIGGLLLLSGRSDSGSEDTARGLVVARGELTGTASTEREVPGARTEIPSEPTPAERAAAARQIQERLRAEDQERAEEARHQARQRVPVVLYSTTWCGVCRQAREYLSANNVRYTEHDVEANPSARADHLRLNPRGSVPTFDVGGEVLVGFSDAAFRQALDAAVDRQRL